MNYTTGRPPPAPQTATTLAAMRERLHLRSRFNLGFPAATDLDLTPIADLLAAQTLNNIGDPNIDGVYHYNSKALEREVIDFCAGLFRAPPARWGYITAGGSASNLEALHQARTLMPGAVVYFSDAAHASIAKNCQLLTLPAVRIRSQQYGEMDYDDLRAQVGIRRHRPAIVVATIGTTDHEATDDLHTITIVLDDLAVTDRYVHADAALSGIPLALLDPDDRPGFDFADGADSIAISGHKFLGAHEPCSVFLTRAEHRPQPARAAGYTRSPDTTISGSRSGHAALRLWYALQHWGLDGLRDRATRSRLLAAQVHARLHAIGWDSHRHPHAFTVNLRTPPEAVAAKWILGGTDQWSRLITMPGITEETLNEFVGDLTPATPTPARAPAQRNTFAGLLALTEGQAVVMDPTFPEFRREERPGA